MQSKKILSKIMRIKRSNIMGAGGTTNHGTYAIIARRLEKTGKPNSKMQKYNNPSGFKYVNYEDPYAKIYPTKCPVCGKVAMIDKYGNGECKNCLWNLDRACETNPDSVQYPNMLSLNKAKLLYKQGKPLKPSFEDFIKGLIMYSEMTFYYANREAAVYYSGEKICFDYDGRTQKFTNENDFYAHASIGDKLLKDIWNNIEKADYMQC